jgi:serine protease
VQEEIRLIVTYDKGVSETKQADIIDSLDSLIPTEVSDMTSTTSVVIATGDANEALQELSKTPGVRAVSEDEIKKLAVTPNDTYFSQQWHLQTWGSGYGINAESAWDVTTGSNDVTVAVLDTGKINHPDLTDKWLAGYDFVQNDTDPTDPGLTPGGSSPSNWHGTAIAGIIAGATNNSLGISGINWNSKIIPIRVGTGDGGYDSNIINGIRWCKSVG